MKCSNKFDAKYKIIIILLISILGATLSGCLNPLQQVPVLKINITFVERQGVVQADNYTITQGSVSYIDRPRKTQADSFPAIVARETLVKDNTTIIGPWEALSYKGSGSYSFNIGFRDNYYPVSGNPIHVSIIVVDKTGERIGYVVKDMVWQ